MTKCVLGFTLSIVFLILGSNAAIIIFYIQSYEIDQIEMWSKSLVCRITTIVNQTVYITFSIFIALILIHNVRKSLFYIKATFMIESFKNEKKFIQLIAWSFTICFVFGAMRSVAYVIMEFLINFSSNHILYDSLILLTPLITDIIPI